MTTRWNRIHSLLGAVAAAGLLAAGGQSAEATVFSYEGFDYGDGSLIGNSGGTGWGGAWAGSDASTGSDHTLDYQDGNGTDLPTEGVGARMDRTSRSTNRMLADTHSDGVLWMSYLFQPTLNTFEAFDKDENEFSMQLRDVTGSSAVTRLSIGKDVNNDNYVVNDVDTGTSAITDDVQFFAVRYDFDNGSVHVFRNPDLGSAPDTGTAWATLTGLDAADMAFDQVRFSAPPGNFPSFDTQFRFDEIRLGSDYSSVVVPEPATLGLLGTGLMLMVARRRRTQA